MTTLPSLWLLVWLLVPSAAIARIHFSHGQRLFQQHDYRRALEEFTTAAESSPTEVPDLWFDIGQCHRNLGHARQAVAAFERYLVLKPDAADREKVRTLIVALGGRVAAVEVTPAPLVIAPPPDEPTPTPSLTPADPKPDAAAIAAPAAVPLIPPADAPPARPHRRWKLWTGVAVGVALVAVGVGLGVGLGTSGGGGSSAAPPMLGSAATFDTRGH
jgi:tetratricopeptide (TPR) repeat protein